MLTWKRGDTMAGQSKMWTQAKRDKKEERDSLRNFQNRNAIARIQR